MKVNQKNKIVVAIDGPSGSGKSTIAKLLSKKLKVPYLDTGAMYRALTYLAICKKIPLTSPRKLADLFKKSPIEFKKSKTGENRVFISGLEVTKQIRMPELTNKVHFCAKSPAVRSQMVKAQRKLAQKTGGIVEGRDIGTVVFPNTPYKFYLDAKPEKRARRRYLELKNQGVDILLKDIVQDQKKRDVRDKGRKTAPLKAAKDATMIDTTSLTIPEVVGRIATHIKAKKAPKKQSE